MPRFALLLTIAATMALGACTVHHHHPDQAQAYHEAQQPRAQQGAPGQVLAPVDPYANRAAPRHDNYNNYDNYNYDRAPRQRPGAPYVAPTRRAQPGPCTCEHRHDRLPATVAPRRAMPRGPVTPADLQTSNPADWLE